jgi:type II secretory pathway component GspD/PulD (secretin)
MKKVAVLMLVATVIGLCAEDETVNRIFQLKYANAGHVANLVRPYGAVNADDQMKAITVQGRKSLMPEIEQIIQRFDVPPPPVQNIEVTIY